MIKRINEKNYSYKHPLASIIVDEVEIGVSQKGRRSLSATEIERLSRLAALEFLKVNYKKSMITPNFTLSPKIIRAIIAILNINQMEFGILIGCQKSKVSKILNNSQEISKPQALLAIERLTLELTHPGSTQALLGKTTPHSSKPNKKMIQAINNLRFDPPKKSA